MFAVSLVSGAPPIPHGAATDVAGSHGHGIHIDPDPPMRGGGVPQTRPLSPELTAAIARAQYAWARRFAPHLLQGWLDD